eukprot:TRINITY_DN2378_c0_g1_i7.p1 TRINITY_DN2378_c0_g1~~TRINITY_DN2378_c0_g1_i7.p1  ORF type:complete len:157 (+),score=13.39 TRINITY_DN2378_c0_g1_i7:473-943(+)
MTGTRYCSMNSDGGHGSMACDMGVSRSAGVPPAPVAVCRVKVFTCKGTYAENERPDEGRVLKNWWRRAGQHDTGKKEEADHACLWHHHRQGLGVAALLCMGWHAHHHPVRVATCALATGPYSPLISYRVLGSECYAHLCAKRVPHTTSLIHRRSCA